MTGEDSAREVYCYCSDLVVHGRDFPLPSLGSLSQEGESDRPLTNGTYDNPKVVQHQDLSTVPGAAVEHLFLNWPVKLH